MYIIYHVEEARTSFLLGEGCLPEKVLLSMAGNLGWGSCGHIVPRDASPVTLSKLLETD